MNAIPSLPLTDAPERIAQVIVLLCQTVTMRCSLRVRTLTREQVEYICGRLLAARARFRGIVARIRAGNPPKERARKPRTRPAKPIRAPEPAADLNQGFPPPRGWRRWAREDRAAARRAARERAAWEKAANAKPVPLWRGLRQHVFAWLCPLAATVPELRESAPAYAEELRRLLADPEMQALLRSSRALGDSLRSACWALGIEKSLLYPAPLAAASAEAILVPSADTPADTILAAAGVRVSADGDPSRGAELTDGRVVSSAWPAPRSDLVALTVERPPPPMVSAPL